MRRVVITGIGIVSCIGNNKKEVLNSLLNTKSGIVFSEEHKKYNFRSQIIGNVKNSQIVLFINDIEIYLKLFGNFLKKCLFSFWPIIIY